MPQWLDTVRGWISQLVAVMLALVPLAIVIQVLFNTDKWLGNAVVANMMKILTDLGNAGLVGLIALVVLIYLFGMALRK
jgi:hypothetical protein